MGYAEIECIFTASSPLGALRCRHIGLVAIANIDAAGLVVDRVRSHVAGSDSHSGVGNALVHRRYSAAQRRAMYGWRIEVATALRARNGAESCAIHDSVHSVG